MTGTVRRGLYALLAFFISLFIGSSLVWRAKYNYVVYGDKTVLEPQRLGPYLVALGLLLVLGAGLYRLVLKLNRRSPRIVVPAALAASCGLQVAVLFLWPRLPTDDSRTVLSLALAMLYDHDYSTYQVGGYLYMFPFNSSIVLYLRTLLAIFPDNYLTIKLFNVLFSLVTTLTIHLIHRELAGKRDKENDYGALVFAALFVPALLMSNLVYNDVIATALLTSAVYFILRFVRTASLKPLALGSVLLALGNSFRSIGVLVLIAAILYIALNAGKPGMKKAALAVLILAATFNAPGWALNAGLRATHVAEGSITANSAPVYMWLNMGLNRDTLGFWDDRQSYAIYQREAGYDKKASIPLFKEEIRRKLSDSSVGDLAGFYVKKLAWMWTEGTYQSARYGIGNDGGSSSGVGGRRGGFLLGGYSYASFATELFRGDSDAMAGLLWFMYGTTMLMYAFILVRLVGGIRARRYGETLLVLIVLGFIAFYLVWEIKSRYLFPVYPLLIVLAYLGFKDVWTRAFERRSGGHA